MFLLAACFDISCCGLYYHYVIAADYVRHPQFHFFPVISHTLYPINPSLVFCNLYTLKLQAELQIILKYSQIWIQMMTLEKHLYV